MSDIVPSGLALPDSTHRDRRIAWTAGLSVAAHVAVLAWLFWPHGTAPVPAAPLPVTVEIVTP
ncbi:MAG TPA: hypothetical protein VHZ56_12675, partial [Devosia sp.]|nr:hypothetical protein [Devosia sp.]